MNEWLTTITEPVAPVVQNLNLSELARTCLMPLAIIYVACLLGMAIWAMLVARHTASHGTPA
ncbi:MAG: hypothetical protein KBE04_11015 [Phycisphaerae bacterium]|nr:hypothetical protein [Phycisphaerae bacterium]